MLNSSNGYVTLRYIDRWNYGGGIIMALKQVTLSQDMEQEIGRYNDKDGWVRLYLNTDNGYIWAEDTDDCPKANHITYDTNKNIVVVFEKGKEGGCECCGCTITTQEVITKCNDILASL